MKTKISFERIALLIMATLMSLNINAGYKGTITIAVGEEYYVDIDFGSYITQTGTWSKSNSTFVFVTQGNRGCKIRGNQVGTGTLEYIGAVGGDFVDYSWTVNVVSSNSGSIPDGYKDGDRFYYTSNGVSIQYKVISAANKTCMVGTGSLEDDRVAVSKSLSVQSLTIPSTANGFKVVEVADAAFGECKNIKSIIMPETIELIGSAAFQHCASLTSITVPNAVTEIGYGAFSLCDNIEEITIGKGVEWMDADQFWGDKKLKSITVLATEPPTMKDYDGAPNEVYSLATLYVPEGCVEKYKAANTWKQFKRIEKIGGGSDKPEGIAIDATNFPDANFRNYLLGLSCGKDGVLTEAEIKGITSINVSEKNISSLKGIEYFTALKYLHCSSNQLTALDVSKNTALTELYCGSNQLTALDVSKSTALTTLNCSSNQLTALDVSKNTMLTTFYCYSNQLTALDVSKNTALTHLWCYSNKIRGTAMDVLVNSLPANITNEQHKLRIIYDSYSSSDGNVCTKSQVAVAKAKGWTVLTSIGSEYEGSEEDNSTVVATIDEINFPDANFRNYLLSQSYGRDGVLTENEIKGITEINVRSQNIGNLKGIEHFTALDSLLCSFNQLTLLDVSKNTALTFLECVVNQLQTLDVSKNIALVKLNCGSNQLTALDVSKNTALAELTCHNNMIKGKDMDNLINSLPQNMTNDEHGIYIYRTMDGNTGNICTKKQVAAIKAKGWTPRYHNGTGWAEYEGGDEPKGTVDNPFTPAEANAYGSSLAANEQSQENYYIRGMVVSIKEQFGTQYGNATFYISADGTEKDQFYIYRALYLGNTKYAGQDLQLRVGDDVVICGKITNYLGILPETVQEKAYVVSINGITSGIEDVQAENNADAPVYNLSGQRMTSPANGKKGVYIIGGKKVIVK